MQTFHENNKLKKKCYLLGKKKKRIEISILLEIQRSHGKC